jgi:hypothetical protein
VVIGVQTVLQDVVLVIGRDLMFRWVTTFDGPGRKMLIRKRKA